MQLGSYVATPNASKSNSMYNVLTNMILETELLQKVRK